MFHFKQFSIDDSRCAMKVGTDGVLLGAWCQVDKASHILDLGTGSGLIALMLAQKNPTATITALDIDAEATKQARYNVLQSPWSTRIQVQQGDFTEWFPAQRYDAIVSNPPFFQETLTAPDAQRAIARHTRAGLHFESLIAHSATLLKPGASLQVIIPKQSEELFIRLCANHHLHLHRNTQVHTVSHKPAKRALLHFLKEETRPTPSSSLILMQEGKRSPAFQQLTEEFYL